MSEIPVKHLVLVRHGQSEGDVRRSMQAAQPSSDNLNKHPHNEEQTPKGHLESTASGVWLTEHVLREFNLGVFDWQLTSPLIRTQQSADSLGLSVEWRNDNRLSERDRGGIQGMTKKQHQTQYPDSFRQMQEHPFHWVPSGGESILRVSYRFGELVDDFLKSDARSAVFMTHRDVMWAAHLKLDGMDIDDIVSMKTDFISNGYIFHYTNVNPENGAVDGSELAWKRSVAPWGDMSTEQMYNWVQLSGQ